MCTGCVTADGKFECLLGVSQPVVKLNIYWM